MSKEKAKKPKKMDRELYKVELLRLQVELVEMQEWVKFTSARVVVIFGGRDAADKGSAVKRVTEYLSPWIIRMVTLSTLSKREENQRFFQRYIVHLLAAGEVKLSDRSWCSRGGAERVISYCIADEHRHSPRQCPILKRMFVEDRIILLKYRSPVSDKEQYKRLKLRMTDSMCRWRLSPTDLESITRWEEYSRAGDEMFIHTDIDIAPWNAMKSEDKRKAWINMIHHLLDSIPYEHIERPALEFPERPSSNGYWRTDRVLLREVPDYASTLKTSSEQRKYVDPKDKEILQGHISSI